MFGIIRPCRNRLGEQLRAAWMAHLCGMCLALRDEHGQLARIVTNFDAVVVSALVEAQTGPGTGRRREAGPCPLRGMRRASVADGDGARLAAAVSLLLASAKISDHVADGDVRGAIPARAARGVAGRWARAGTTAGSTLALDGAVLLDIAARQGSVEASASSILEVTAPTEAATALAFRHTALVAGRPDNADALAEIGRLFGRVAHLLDAVEDLHDDHATGAWNPIAALALPPEQVRALCDDAVLGVRLALRDVSLLDARLVHVLLVHELETAVVRTFTIAGRPPPPPNGPLSPPPVGWEPPPVGWEPPPDRTGRRNPLTGCLGWLVVCGTCQACCAGEFTDPCSGRQRHGACRGNDCCGGVGDCSDCCDCCDCCGACDCDCGC